MIQSHLSCCVFFFNDTATTEIYTLSLHDALPIYSVRDDMGSIMDLAKTEGMLFKWGSGTGTNFNIDRKSTRLNSSHSQISYAVFCLKKKKKYRSTKSQRQCDQPASHGITVLSTAL